IGYENRAAADDTVAVGRNARALAADGIAIGRNTEVGSAAANAVAIGNGAVATEADTVSFGDAGSERRLVRVAAGTAATDAVNVAQLHAMGSTVASYLGGGAALAGGAWAAPAFVGQGRRRGSVGDAFAAVDGVLSSLGGRVESLESMSPGGGDGLTEAQVQAIAIEVSETGDSATLASAAGYTDEREVAIREDMDSGDAATLSSANRYTDTAIQQLIGFDAGGLNDRMTVLVYRYDQHDLRLHRPDSRIVRKGAIG